MGMKRLALAVVVLVSVLLSGVAVASVMASSGQSPNPTSGNPSDHHETAEDAGVHGGPIDRFHGSGSCGLTSIGGLPGNWTHGDYVSAVAATGDSTMIVQAAQSDCGKPMVAVDHGGSPIGGLPSEAAPQAKDHTSPHVGAGTPGGSPGS
jgi:hypothetical protein